MQRWCSVVPELPEGAKPRPAPIPDAESKAFWDGTLDGRLLVQECSMCGQRQLYGRSFFSNTALHLWALHAWIWRPNPTGMFANYNPRVKLCPGH